MLDDELFSFGGKTGEDEKAEDMIVTKYNPKHTNDIQRLSSVNDFSGHIDNVQNDLDSLKDLLRSDNYQLDSNQLLGVSEDFDLHFRLSRNFRNSNVIKPSKLSEWSVFSFLPFLMFHRPQKYSYFSQKQKYQNTELPIYLSQSSFDADTINKVC